VAVGDASGGPGCCGGVEDVIDGRAGSGWSEVVGQVDPGFCQQAPPLDRTGPSRLGIGQRSAGEGAEADLRVDLDDAEAGVSDPGVDLEEFGA
jgi:hypothetical protein